MIFFLSFSTLLGTVLSLQPQRSVAQGESKEDKVSDNRCELHPFLSKIKMSRIAMLVYNIEIGAHLKPEFEFPASRLFHYGKETRIVDMDISPSLSTIITAQVLNLSSDVLKHVPELIDYESTYKLICDDMNPLNVVLLQEVRK